MCLVFICVCWVCCFCVRLLPLGAPYCWFLLLFGGFWVCWFCVVVLGMCYWGGLSFLLILLLVGLVFGLGVGSPSGGIRLG